MSVEVWDQCNNIIDQTYEQQERRPQKRAVNLFAGLVECSCGEQMSVPSNSPKYVCRGCRNKILAADLEEIYRGRIKGYALSPDEVSAHLSQADRELVEKERLLTAQECELQKTSKELERVYRLYQDGHLDAEGFGRYHKPLDERRKELEENIPKLQAEIDISRVGNLSAEEVATEAQTLYDEWPHLEPEERREIVEAITEKVVVGKDEISIRLYYLPLCKEMALGWRKGRDSNPR